ncbi:serine/threonine protein kinase [Caulobacter sp. RL271]|uniref:non-specific serine/threonine protein kinase n=1 Tax=Caulobacter segnis TaxID=88688 RepID=A0ABY4ZN33_9CAUL|nr:serine/threonine-protein kinase [Caulobacter segnis]USQ93988.1 protein kinase [Caulobacter segnis]
MSDDPADDVAATTGFTQSSLGGRGARRAGRQGILPIGFVLNGIYEVKRFIARGGMGEVYEGVNVNADERVAIKVILPHLAADPKVQALFRKEAKTLISLAHPALVQYRVLAREPRKDLLYIVTDYIDGAPLTQLIGKGPPPATTELVRLTRRLAEGLEAAHSHGAIHRDISPENILLPDGVLNRAKIIDFGIAKSMEIGAQTVVGDGFAGKLGYVAPEQFGDFGRRIGPWTDVYSLGLVALALAGGRAPDMGATLVDAIDRRRAGPDIDAVPATLRPLFARMLSPDPRNRPQTMAELIAALDALDLSNEPSPPQTPSWVPAHDALASDLAADGERTVVHFGSEPPSWLSAEPSAQTAPPIAASPDIPHEAPEDPPQGRTVFAPSPLPESPKAIEPPPPATAPEETPLAEDVVLPSQDQDEDGSKAAPERGQIDDPNREEKVLVETSAPAAPVEDHEDALSPAPPAMDVAYGAGVDAPEPTPSRQEPARTRVRPDGKLIVLGAAAAVVVAGIGFTILSSQNKGQLPAQTASAPAPPASPDVVRAEQAIAAAVPSIPCSWLTVGHGQASDGSTSIQVSGAAGDPAAVNRAVSAAARKAGSTGLQIDSTGLLAADQAACPLLDATRGARDPKAVAAPAVVALQTRFEIDRGLQGCPINGLWAQPVINIAPDPSKNYSLIAIQPSGRLEQFAASREQLDKLAARNPNLYQDLGNGRHRVSMCLSDPGLAGLLMLEGAGPFDLGLRPGAAAKPPRDFAKRLGQLAQSKGWTMQMAWFQLANDQPDQPEIPALDPAALRAQKLAEAAKRAAAVEAAANAAAPVVAAPAPEPEKLPADYVACRRFAGGAWEELGYAPRAACVERVFAGRCDVQTGRSGDIELRRNGGSLQAKTGKGFRKWQNVGKSDCEK